MRLIGLLNYIYTKNENLNVAFLLVLDVSAVCLGTVGK